MPNGLLRQPNLTERSKCLPFPPCPRPWCGHTQNTPSPYSDGGETGLSKGSCPKSCPAAGRVAAPCRKQYRTQACRCRETPGQVSGPLSLAPARVSASWTDDFRCCVTRYDSERAKRLTDTGNGQYHRLVDLAVTDPRFARMLSDPWAASVRRQICYK